MIFIVLVSCPYGPYPGVTMKYMPQRALGNLCAEDEHVIFVVLFINKHKMGDTTLKASTLENQNVSKKQKDNVFSEPWERSDVVLVVEDKEFHVHRWMLSMQSPVFDAMFNGSFKDSTQEKIELKDDKHEAMLLFLQLLYPANMLDEDYGKVDINNENVLSIAELADKYGAKNVIKQCLKEVDDLKPENTMRLLPYAVQHESQVGKVLDIIARHISINTLANFAPELDNKSVYVQTLETKCRVYEDAIERANIVMLHLLGKSLTSAMDKEQDFTPAETQCPRHTYINPSEFRKAKQCIYCSDAYLDFFITYVFRGSDHIDMLYLPRYVQKSPPENAKDLFELLKLMDDIINSLQE